MIGVRLEGGLGNQLFQYAAARALAIRHETDIVIDQSALSHKGKSKTLREYELDAFNCALIPEAAKRFRFSGLAKRCKLIYNFLSPWKVVLEKGQNFNKCFFNAGDNSYLIGFWQSHRYFEGVADILRTELTPKFSLSPKSVNIKSIIEKSVHSVSVHVRRGDYVSLNSAKKFHGVLSINYYKKAISKVSTQFPLATYFIFSDDIEWCKKNFPKDQNIVYIEHNPPSEAWQDLMLMSYCQHHIIANSSFSWWGAWLGQDVNRDLKKIVIYPTNWFMNQSVIYEDRFPANWQGL
ncbi:alpha-1,2-fucosyltransferase [Polynucleobacter paneuropaeus]|nr:alpha-1,2-fucosyltransferase [Polynucleobacter paneuropaeus]